MVVMVVPVTQYSPHLPISCLFVHLLLEIIFLMYWAELSSGSHVVTVSFFSIPDNLFFFQSNPNIYWRSVILPFSFLWVSVTLCCVPLILFFVCALFPYIFFLPCCPKWDLHFSFLLTMLWFIFPLQIGITILIFTSECFCSIFFETNISFPAIDNLPFIFRNSRLILIWTVMLFIVSEFKVGNLTYANLVTLAVIIKPWFL